MADELTAVLGGLIGYVAVLAALGVGVIYLLEMDEVRAAIEPPTRAVQAAERPYVVDDGGASRPELRQSMAVK